MPLTRLEAVVAASSGGDPATSYVARLEAGGLPLAARKLGEEAVEVVVAALAEGDLTAEIADLLFHLAVVMRLGGISVADVAAELERREARSGIEEKLSRGT